MQIGIRQIRHVYGGPLSTGRKKIGDPRWFIGI